MSDTSILVCAVPKEIGIPEFPKMVEEAKAEGIDVKVAHDMNKLFEYVESPQCFGVIFVEGFALDMISGIQQMKFATDAKCIFVTRGKENAKMLGYKAKDAGAIAIFDPPVHRVSLLARARQLRAERPKAAPPKVEAEEEVQPQFRGIRYVFPKGDFRALQPTWEKLGQEFRKKVDGANLKTFEEEFHKLLKNLRGAEGRVRLNLYSLCPRELSEGIPSKHFRRITGSEDSVRGPVFPMSSRNDLEVALIEGKSIVIPSMDIFRKENKFDADLSDQFKSRAILLLANLEGKLSGALGAEYGASIKGNDLEMLETILCFMRSVMEPFEAFDYVSRAYYGIN
jgi:hypothetical protein